MDIYLMKCDKNGLLVKLVLKTVEKKNGVGEKNAEMEPDVSPCTHFFSDYEIIK